MARRRKTQTGKDAQSIASVPGQRYGEGVEQAQLQRAMPAPDVGGVSPAMPTTPASPAGAGAPPVTPQGGAPVDLQALLAGMPKGLLDGTANPDQPLTTGLSTGPGRGPEAVSLNRARTPFARTLRELAARTGDPLFNELADRAGL